MKRHIMVATITNTVKDTIEKFSVGFVFAAKDFPVEIVKQKTVNKILNNMVSVGQICRLSKGRFYKPQITESGELPLDAYQIVKDLLEKNGKIIGYLTGYTAFKELGLTTQLPFELQIGVANVKRSTTRNCYRISFIKQQNSITKENVLLLRLLDCLRFFKNIPDSMPDETCRRLLLLLKDLDKQQRIEIKELSLNYTPQAIALLGAMFDTINSKEDTSMLHNALNPQTSYYLGISEGILRNQPKWNIKWK
jgi:hypothetical protein